MLMKVSLDGLEFAGCAVMTRCGPCLYRARASMSVSAGEIQEFPADRKATAAMYHGQVPCKGQTTKQGSICSVYTNAGAKGNSSLSNMVEMMFQSLLSKGQFRWQWVSFGHT